MKSSAYHTISSLAEEAGLPAPTVWQWARHSKIIPPPDVNIGRRSLYSAKLAGEVLETLKKIKNGEKL